METYDHGFESIHTYTSYASSIKHIRSQSSHGAHITNTHYFRLQAAQARLPLAPSDAGNVGVVIQGQVVVKVDGRHGASRFWSNDQLVCLESTGYRYFMAGSGTYLGPMRYSNNILIAAYGWLRCSWYVSVAFVYFVPASSRGKLGSTFVSCSNEVALWCDVMCEKAPHQRSVCSVVSSWLSFRGQKPRTTELRARPGETSINIAMFDDRLAETLGHDGSTDPGKWWLWCLMFYVQNKRTDTKKWWP